MVPTTTCCKYLLIWNLYELVISLRMDSFSYSVCQQLAQCQELIGEYSTIIFWMNKPMNRYFSEINRGISNMLSIAWCPGFNWGQYAERQSLDTTLECYIMPYYALPFSSLNLESLKFSLASSQNAHLKKICRPTEKVTMTSDYHWGK